MRLRSLVVLVLFALVAPGVAAANVETSSVSGAISFHADPGRLLSIDDHGDYRGTLEIRRGADGLSIVNELALEDYLLGIREVPGIWPMETLKAQAVAARTYALWEQRNARWTEEGFDICPTDACQVYAGASVEEGESGRRWTEAVRATEGQVLVYEGRPALARYHASSGGVTLPNHIVYPGSTPRPYLAGIADPDDSISPLHTWTVHFPHHTLESILRAGLGFEGPLIRVLADQHQRRAAVHTEDGELEMRIDELRAIVNEHAPGVAPDTYPGPREDGERMPVTLPSARFDIEHYDGPPGEDGIPEPGGFRFHGRGYGHGVGMSQWGAMGRASRGESYLQILAAYYGGLQPQAWGSDDMIRVEIVSDAAEVRITGDDPFSVTSADGEINRSTDGVWVVRPGPGDSLTVEGPPQPVVAAAPEPVPLALSNVLAPSRVEIRAGGETFSLPVTFSVTAPAFVEATLVGNGGPVSSGAVEVDAGAGSIVLALDTTTLDEGTYQLAVRAVNGEEEVLIERAVAVLRPPPEPPPVASRDPLPAAIAALAAAVAVTLAFASNLGRLSSRRP